MMLKSEVKKIIEAFRLFPFNPNRINDIVHDINSLCKDDIKFICNDSNTYGNILELSFEINKFGVLHREIDTEDTIHNDKKIFYHISYETYNIEYDNYSLINEYRCTSTHKKIVDDLCENIIVWMTGLGKDKTTIPLIISAMPDLANYILLKV